MDILFYQVSKRRANFIGNLMIFHRLINNSLIHSLYYLDINKLNGKEKNPTCFLKRSTTMLDHPQDAYRIAKDRQRNIRNSVKGRRLGQQILNRQQQQPTNISLTKVWLFLGPGMLIIASVAWLLT